MSRTRGVSLPPRSNKRNPSFFPDSRTPSPRFSCVLPMDHPCQNLGVYPIDVALRANKLNGSNVRGGDGMLTVTAHEYNLTFRCINCGRYEASANYSSDEVVSEDQTKARRHRVPCTACGWKGEACGVAASRILRDKGRVMKCFAIAAI